MHDIACYNYTVIPVTCKYTTAYTKINKLYTSYTAYNSTK